MSKKYYSNDHILFVLENDQTILVYLADYLSKQINPDFFQFTSAGERIGAYSPIGVIESKKFSFEITAPFDCTILAINEALFSEKPKACCQLPWLVKISPHSENWKDELMDEETYGAYVSP